MADDRFDYDWSSSAPASAAASRPSGSRRRATRSPCSSAGSALATRISRSTWHLRNSSGRRLGCAASSGSRRSRTSSSPRLRRRRRQPRLREHAVCAAPAFSRMRSGPASTTGRRRSRRTTTRPSACSASNSCRSTATTRCCCSSWRRLRRRAHLHPHAVRRLLRRAGRTVPDPYFGGEGPPRTGCTRCGGCMVGCRVGAKNTLLRTTSVSPSASACEIIPERQVVDIVRSAPRTAPTATRSTTEHPGAWFAQAPAQFTARGVVMAAGALGTNRLLADVQAPGSLPGSPIASANLVRTNSESILAVTLPALTLGRRRRGDQREHPSARGHAHRVLDLWTEGRLHVDAVHAARRRGHTVTRR